MHFKPSIVALLMIGQFFAAHAGAAQQPPAKPGSTAAAKVGEEIITLEEIERSLQTELAKVERDRYNLIQQKLDQLISDKLLAAEAKRRGISVDELLKQEVAGKAPTVTDADVEGFIAQNRGRIPQGDDPELKLKVWEYLRDQKKSQQRGDYIQTLRTKAGVTVYIEEPAATRVQVDAGKGFARGAKEATVNIVEFSDFGCPFCKAATATVRQVMAQYGGKVRWVFRDFPIASLHPLAPKSHEAARCAAEQGKFWEYHDLLFERSPKLNPPELKQYARDLKLNGGDFDKCIDSGKHQPAVAGDVQEGQKLGITGTPTFFVNGRMLVGAQPIAAFQKVIDNELARKPGQ